MQTAENLIIEAKVLLGATSESQFQSFMQLGIEPHFGTRHIVSDRPVLEVLNLFDKRFDRYCNDLCKGLWVDVACILHLKDGETKRTNGYGFEDAGNASFDIRIYGREYWCSGSPVVDWEKSDEQRDGMLYHHWLTQKISFCVNYMCTEIKSPIIIMTCPSEGCFDLSII